MSVFPEVVNSLCHDGADSRDPVEVVQVDLTHGIGRKIKCDGETPKSV